MSCRHPKPLLDHHTFQDGLVVSSCRFCGAVITWNINDDTVKVSEEQTPENKPWQFDPTKLVWEPRKPTPKGPWDFCAKSDDKNYIELDQRLRASGSYKVTIDNWKYFVQRGGIGRRISTIKEIKEAKEKLQEVK